MIITTEQIKQIAFAGGGLVIDAQALSFQQLKGVAGAANSGKAALTVTSPSSLTVAELLELAALAPGLINFDLTS
ncbi:MAG: hypothetical protein JWO52_1929 [Gammaproteobacteria bacterium]|jgi:hypothetical protein|nr:hypothetical protein [Gammaproteobacteria bacterium]